MFLIFDSLNEVNFCAFNLMEIFSIEKMDKGAISSAEKYRSRNERRFNYNQKNISKEEVTDGI